MCVVCRVYDKVRLVMLQLLFSKGVCVCVELVSVVVGAGMAKEGVMKLLQKVEIPPRERYTHTHTHSNTHTHTHTHTQIHTHTYSHTQNTYTYSVTHTHSHTHPHPHTLTHPHSGTRMAILNLACLGHPLLKDVRAEGTMVKGKRRELERKERREERYVVSRWVPVLQDILEVNTH